jgi:hypothetical protein
MSDFLPYRVSSALLALCVCVRPVATKPRVFTQLHRDVTGLYLLLSEINRTAGGPVGDVTGKSLRTFLNAPGRITRLEKLIAGLGNYAHHFKTKALSTSWFTVKEFGGDFITTMRALSALTPTEIHKRFAP